MISELLVHCPQILLFTFYFVVTQARTLVVGSEYKWTYSKIIVFSSEFVLNLKRSIVLSR